MEIKDIQKRKEKRVTSINLRISQEVCDWMNEKDISPTALFNKAVEELRSKDNPKSDMDISDLDINDVSTLK